MILPCVLARLRSVPGHAVLLACIGGIEAFQLLQQDLAMLKGKTQALGEFGQQLPGLPCGMPIALKFQDETFLVGDAPLELNNVLLGLSQLIKLVLVRTPDPNKVWVASELINRGMPLTHVAQTVGFNCKPCVAFWKTRGSMCAPVQPHFGPTTRCASCAETMANA